MTRAPPRGRRVQCRANHRHTHTRTSGITHAKVWGSQERENLHFLELSASFPVSYNSPVDPELDLHDLGDLYKVERESEGEVEREWEREKEIGWLRSDVT